ncbi:MAG: 1-acyl-sn-glycerol-3-phosphate acyltransferase [Myxococcales bacterium]|nr:1-acyl-sn-glycerol-3-phosphate acyltransferase [Myxococcales bacterium]
MSAPQPPGAIVSGARWAASLAISAAGLAAASALRPLRPWTSLRLVHATCEACHRVFGLRLTRVDRNHGAHAGFGQPPYLFVYLNQTSLIEIFVLPWMAPRPYRIVVNLEYLLLPIFGWSSLGLGCRVVVRQWPAQGKRAIRRAIDDLRRGGSYVISIEGRRSPDGALQPYKKGAAVMAIESGATIIPVVLRGTRERLPYGAWRVRPGTIEVDYLEAIETEGLTYEDRDELVARLRALAEAELSQA